MLFRIGHGYDVHALAEGLPLVLGGVGIEHDKEKKRNYNDFCRR